MLIILSNFCYFKKNGYLHKDDYDSCMIHSLASLRRRALSYIIFVRGDILGMQFVDCTKKTDADAIYSQ